MASIEIRQPVEDVFDFISDASNRTRYDQALIEVRQTPEGPARIGTKIVEVRRAMGIKREMVTEVSELEPHQLIGFRTLEGDSTNAFGTYRVEPIAEGTRLTLDFTLDPQGWMKYITPIMAAGLKRDIQTGLSNIKALFDVQAEAE